MIDYVPIPLGLPRPLDHSYTLARSVFSILLQVLWEQERGHEKYCWRITDCESSAVLLPSLNKEKLSK